MTAGKTVVLTFHFVAIRISPERVLLRIGTPKDEIAQSIQGQDRPKFKVAQVSREINEIPSL